MPQKKDLAALIKRLRAQGWRCEQNRRNHWRLTSPTGGTPVWTGSTPSDPRAHKNLIAELRRRGADL